MIYPFEHVAIISQPFGAEHKRYRDWGLKGHNGIDLAVQPGLAVLCVEDGEVIESRSDPHGYGYYVKVRTAGGADWVYAHMDLWWLPRPGQWVTAGDPLGVTDNSGVSLGPHLHLAWRPSWYVRGWPYDGYADFADELAKAAEGMPRLGVPDETPF